VGYRIPPYDLDAFLIEVELLIDWYLPLAAHSPPFEARAEFLSLWREALRPHSMPRKTWFCATSIREFCCGLPTGQASHRSALLISRDT